MKGAPNNPADWLRLTKADITRTQLEDRYLNTTPDPEPDEAECRELLADVERLMLELFPLPP